MIIVDKVSQFYIYLLYPINHMFSIASLCENASRLSPRKMPSRGPSDTLKFAMVRWQLYWPRESCCRHSPVCRDWVVSSPRKLPPPTSVLFESNKDINLADRCCPGPHSTCWVSDQDQQWSGGPAARTKQSWTVLRGDFQIQISHCKLVNCFLWPILEVHILISIKGTTNVFIRIYCFSYISCPVWKIRFHYSSLITFRRNYCNLAWNKNWFKIEVTLPIMILVKSRNFH